MTPEDTIQFALDFYDNYHSRDAVLNHMFCVNGCGYEWHNGELVLCDIDAERMDRYRLKKPVVRAEPCISNVQSYETRMYYRQIGEDLRNERRAKKGLEPVHECEPKLWDAPNSNIISIPENVTIEWLAVVSEVLSHFKELGISIPIQKTNNLNEYRKYILPNND